MSGSTIPFAEAAAAVISQTVEYALRAIVTIAQHDGAPCTAQKIAEITRVPAPYLSKLMQGLVRAKLVTSKRGLHGGFVLTKAADAMTVLDVVDAVEPFQRIHSCPLEISSHQGTLCPLHRRLDSAMAMVEEMFRQTTVAELLSQPGNISPLCEEQKVMQIELDQVQAGGSKPSGSEQTRQRKSKV